MLRWVQKRIGNIKFKTKILCIIGCVALIPTIVLVVYFMIQVSTLRNTIQDSLELSFQQQVVTVNTAINRAIAAARSTSTSEVASGFFEIQRDKGDCVLDYVKNFRPLITMTQNSGAPEISAIRFYTKNERLFSNLNVINIYRRSENPEQFEKIFAELNKKTYLIQPTGLTRPDAAKNSLSLFLPVVTSSSRRTFMECEISFSDIYSTLRLGTDNFSNTGYTLIHRSGEILFCSDPKWEQDIPELASLWEENAANKTVVFQGESYLINSAYLSNCDCLLIGHSNAGIVTAELEQISIFYCFLLISCFFIACLIANAMVNHLLRRTDSINAAIREIQRGNFKISLEPQGTDFLDNISENLNEMASRIDSLIQNNYKKQIQIKELEVKMLSQQISPHFLYNTLEGLRMYALDRNDINVSDALASLGKLLRYYADTSGDFSPMEAELEAIRNYITIMQVLEGKECRLTTDISPQLTNCSIPRFVLQPLVENSIKHSVESACPRELHIHLDAYTEHGKLTLVIADNGMGVNREEVQKIQGRLDTAVSYEYGIRQNSIGLYNTNARIKLIYGSQYGISFSSVQGMGSTVTVALPLEERKTDLPEAGKGDEHD